MTAHEHYETHLAKIYGWMTGDFESRSSDQKEILQSLGIAPNADGKAVDLGCGHGLQSIALATLGYEVTAIDFNTSLLNELSERTSGLPIKIVHDDLLNFTKIVSADQDLITCMGDTITHLNSTDDIDILCASAYSVLRPGGRILFSFRDLTEELPDDKRFIPVKSDEQRILTCFLEYFNDYVKVHDILHEKINGNWQLTVSHYRKLRLNKTQLESLLTKNDFKVIEHRVVNRMHYLLSEKDHSLTH
jgi:2-polyprenyl-3-methyl-5-hydroxy-6-metoxy-1,4-benzoquinol methylase